MNASGRVLCTPAQLRASLGGRTAGLVPTMGALHEGHLSLIRKSAAENELTVVSIFVNPTQFDQPADLAAYPRDILRDEELAVAAGADLIYAPAVGTIYPAGCSTRVAVAGLTERWEGASRPGHFAGVATVVTILINTVRPTHSYFGEKDFQQLAMIRQMHRDLVLPGEIVGCPTVRDRDGLALSSRNARLTGPERAAARALPDALFAMRDLVDGGQMDVASLVAHGQEIIAAEPLLALDYLAIVSGRELSPLERVQPGARVIVAAQAGTTRLIDNLAVAPDSAH